MLTLTVFGAGAVEVSGFFHIHMVLKNQTIYATAWKKQKASCLRTFLWRLFYVVLCFVFQLNMSPDMVTGVKRLLHLYCMFKWNLFLYISHMIKPKTLVLQQVCSMMPIDLCHHPSQLFKGVWELVTSFVLMESKCKVFRNCDPGRVLFVEGKWTNLLGCVGKYPCLFMSGSGVLVQGCGMSYWDNSVPLWSLGWMSLYWVGLGTAILFCIWLLQHWTLTAAAVLSFSTPLLCIPSSKNSPWKRREMRVPRMLPFPCPERRKHLYVLPPSSQPTMSSLSFVQGDHEWWGKNFLIPACLSHLSWEEIVSIYIILKAMLFTKDLRYL